MTTLEALRLMLTDPGLAPAARLTPVTIRLFKNDITPTPQMVLADFEEADFEGYAALHPAATGTAWDDVANNAILSYIGVHFAPSDATNPNTIYGWYMIGETAPMLGKLLAAARFPAPVPMANAFDAIDFAPTFKIGVPST